MRTPSLSAFSHWADFTSLKNPPKGDSCLHVLANLLHVALTVEIVLDVQNLRDVLICPDNSGYLIQLWLALKPRCRSAVSTRRHAQAMCQTRLIHRASALLWQEEVRFWVMAQLPAQLDAQLPVGWKNRGKLRGNFYWTVVFSENPGSPIWNPSIPGFWDVGSVLVTLAPLAFFCTAICTACVRENLASFVQIKWQRATRSSKYFPRHSG